MKVISIALLALLLAACGGSYDDEKRQQYIDQCVIEVGPQGDKYSVHEYCLAKWRETQREK